MSTSNKIELKDITFSFDQKAIIQDFTFTFHPEKIYAIVGPSGAGKTTLLHLLAQIQPLQQGTISFYEEDKRPLISYVPQDYGLLPWQTAWQAILSGFELSVKRQATKKEIQQLEQMMTEMNLIDFKENYPNQLSGGQKQRIAVTRGFAAKSELLLMDEPFSALDAFTREQSQALFLNQWNEHPRLTIFVTHDIEEALLLAHEIIVLQANPGKIKTVISSPFQKKNQLSVDRQSVALFESSVFIRREIE